MKAIYEFMQLSNPKNLDPYLNLLTMSDIWQSPVRFYAYPLAAFLPFRLLFLTGLSLNIEPGPKSGTPPKLPNISPT